MIRFKNFLKESQWMYHGTPYPKELSHIHRNEKTLDTDKAIGAHFAADPEVAKKFASGMDRTSYATKGVVYKTKRPTRSELEVVPQKKGHQDEDSVETHVFSTVFSHPDNKNLFIRWHKNKFSSTHEQASNIHDKLSNKKNIPVDHKDYGYDHSNANTFRSFVNHHGTYYSSSNGKNIHKEILDKFTDHMASKGKKGLVYKNTNGKETDGADSNKSYIIFEPHKLNIEKHND